MTNFLRYNFSCQKGNKSQPKKQLLLLLIAVFIGAVIFNQDYYWKVLSTNLFGTAEQEVLLPSLPQAELAVESVKVFPAAPVVSDVLDFKVKIVNLGEKDAEKLKVKLVDDSGWGAVQNVSVKSKLYRYVDFSLPTLKEHQGVHHFQVILDTRNEVAETDEQNNIVSLDVEIK